MSTKMTEHFHHPLSTTCYTTPPPMMAVERQPLVLLSGPASKLPLMFPLIKRASGFALFAVLAIFLVTSKGFRGSPNLVGTRRLSEGSALSGKPIIYTFFIETGNAVDQSLLKLWQGEWTKAGWVPRVLTLEDAQQNPHYETVQGMLKSLSLGLNERLRFLGWLAMSNQPSGGFMASIDTYPLAWNSNELPNGGRLTVYQYSKEGGHPSLVSAAQKEYFRFAWALVENALQHRQDTSWSDVKSLHDMYHKSQEEAYVMTHGVLSGLRVLDGKSISKETCDRTTGAFAVSFAQVTVYSAVNRATVAEEWLAGWQRDCKVQSVTLQVTRENETAPQGKQDALKTHNSALHELALNPSTAPRGNKPVIFTFYENVNDPELTGMTFDEDQELIQAWAKSWQQVGWDPRVLDLNVARQHPEFATFESYLAGRTKLERLCYYRYLAMGMAGGGWLSDFDIFPLDRVRWDGTGDPSFLPNQGSLTIHESSKRGGIPSLVSGNSNEWFRLAKEQAESSKAHTSESGWTDRRALEDLYKKSGGNAYKVEDNTVIGEVMLNMESISQGLCKRLQTKLVVHFSHRKSKAKAKLRATEGSKWMEKYQGICLGYDAK